MTDASSSVSVLLRLLRYARGHRRRVWLASFCSVMNKLFDVMPEILIGMAIDVVVRQRQSFVADHEVHKVVAQLKERGKPAYVEEVLADTGDSDSGGGGADMDDSEQDPLYDEAVRIVTETRRASISGIQRRLKIGYNRAARMVEAMEYAGIVGPLESNGSREVLAPPPPED